MDDPAKARAALDAAGELVGADSRSFDWAWSLAAAAETYELGLALTLAPDAPPAAQVYFNPRRRTRAFRQRARTTLEEYAFDAAWLDVVDALVPAEAVGTVLAFDVDRAGPTSGTLYLEEIARLPDAQVDATLREVAASLGLSVDAEHGRVGAPYIWAIDFEARGAVRLKVYRAAAAGAKQSVEEEARHVIGSLLPSPTVDVLFGDGPCSGYMVQRAYGAGPEVLRHKVYRCYPYEHASTVGLAADAIRRLGLLDAEGRAGRRERLFDEAFGTTSIGLAFAPGRATFEYVTVYQALLRGRRD